MSISKTMRLLKILLLITLILMAIPFFNRAKDYLDEKKAKAKVLSETTVKFFKYKKGEEDHKK